MSNENSNNANDGMTEQSLDDFAAELFGGSDAAPENANSEEPVNEDADNADAPEELETVDTQTDDDLDSEEEVVSEDDDTLATDENEEPEEAQDVDPKPKKKNRFQERIDELTAARKEAERQREQDRDELLQKIAKLEGKLESKTEPETQETGDTGLTAPDATDTQKYPLGEYDPKFMQDTVKHMFAVKEAEEAEKAKQADSAREVDTARQTLQTEWNTKIEGAQERYPDFMQKGQQMLTVFEGLDESYGEYLATTIQELDNGPDVFYHLSSNIEEAKEIVGMGAKKATIALAKLEARLSGTQSKETPKQRVTKAKTPPPTNRGSGVVKPKVSHDTDDLEAFERELFRK
jgi:hypothetical protein